MMKFLPARIILIALTLVGCTRSCGNARNAMPPEKVVESYLNKALNMKQVSEREDLLQYTTGRLKEAITSANEEVIKNAYINRHYEIQSYAVIERRDRTPRETEITFRLKYKDLGVSENRPTDTSSAPMVQTENTVALIKEKGTWFIRDVIGAKTSIDFPVSTDSEIKAKPGVISDPSLSETPSPDATEPEEKPE